ncbi:MAG TPA: G-D-S-L family lipolytic protein [Salinimicrobium sp.]|nr:G-D-S-L family lipolytic protein [Salinimicrobium sp.]
MKNIKYIGLLALGLISCEPEFENPVDEPGFYTSGEANFTTYVALGNSLTAGYADAALYLTGQKNSYPKILSEQFAKVGGGDFTQPLVDDNTGGMLLNGEPFFPNRLVLSFDAEGNPVPAPYNGTPTTEITDILSGPFNNLGVPGAKSYHLLAGGYGNLQGLATQTANPYFVRFASSPGTSIIEDAIAQKPTFFSLWIGNNDVLAYATSGGVGTIPESADPATYGSNDITPPAVFTGVYTRLVTALTQDGAGGILVNIPNVTDIPFFTTVPVNAIPLDAETAAVLNAKFAAYNQQILPGLVQAGAITLEEMSERRIIFSEGMNFVTLSDESLTDISAIIQGPPFNLDEQTANLLGQLRQATPADLIPLSSSGTLGSTVGGNPLMIMGVSVPLPDQHVLTPEEQELVAQATQAYNLTIERLAGEFGLALLDASALLSKLEETGIAFDAGVLTSAYVTGGAFSLDGIHLTPRGAALMANKMIEEINATYGATVPKVNIGNYGTITPSNDVKRVTIQ